MTEQQQKIMEYLNAHDAFCRENGIRLVSLDGECATARMTVSPRLFNAGGTDQGGALFALADLAFAGVGNADNGRMVAQGGSISFLRPGSGRELHATARVLHRGKRTAVCEISIVNDDHKEVAHATITGFALGMPLMTES